MDKAALNEILALAANLRFHPKEIDALRNAIKNDDTGVIARLCKEQMKTMIPELPAPKRVGWKSATETEESKNEEKERKRLQK